MKNLWSAMSVRIASLGLALILPFCGCFESKSPLTDRASAVTPLTAGRYLLKRASSSEQTPFLLSVDGKKTYKLIELPAAVRSKKGEKKHQPIYFFLTPFAVTGHQNFYLATVIPPPEEKNEKGPFIYSLVTLGENGAVSELRPNCGVADFRKLAARHGAEAEDASDECTFSTRAQLEDAMKELAESSTPWWTYDPVPLNREGR